MLSSVFYVCLGVCAGMWVISKGIYLGVLDLSFILVLRSSVRVITMNKGELVELLAKSQDAILERVDSKLQELKRSISEDQEECLSSVVKRVKEDNSVKRKKVANEKQFKFNQSVEARFDSAISAIEKKKLDKAEKRAGRGSRLGADDAVKSFRLQPFQFRQAAFLPRSQFRRGTCFACGSGGHWRNNCPNLISLGRSDKSTK